ncbi:MAG: putative DNA binding domain-containing protein [Methanomassiliicoccaceae archaeon]|nr:putative DNA binding domain-containing protein [Methanomassiliicoccaceae archaeon]
MSLPINIKELIERRSVETSRIEYKEGWNPERVIHTICAFANDIDNVGGGYVIMGVEDDNGMPRLPPKGLDKNEIDAINKDLLNKCNTIEPRYVPIVEHTQYNGKEILILWAYGGNDRPYKCPTGFPKAGEGRRTEKGYFIRKMANTIRANDYEVRELFSISTLTPFDDRINQNAELKELRHPFICSYLSEIGSDLYELSLNMSLKDLAKNMHLAEGPEEYVRPLNVGLMFFNERPDNYFRYARIEIVDKPDPTGEGMTEKIFTGPLNRQLRDALDYIRNYMIKEKVFKYPDRAEAGRFFNYPYEAIEEVLVNAVYHKSYQISEPITVVFTPEKMEVVSCPGPDRSISAKDLKNCKLVANYTRNRRIGDMLKELKMTECRNTGIPNMLRAMEKNGSGMPVFKTDEDRRYMSVSIPIHPAFVRKEKGYMNIDTTYYKILRRPTKYRDRSELRDEIIYTLEKEDLALSKLAKKLGYAKITGNVRNAVSELMEEGRIVHTIPDNPTNKKQQLRLI